MFEVIDKLHENSRSEYIIWEIDWGRHEVIVCAYLRDWDYAYNKGWIDSRTHAFSRQEVERSEVPLDKMVRALDKFKPFFKEDDAS